MERGRCFTMNTECGKFTLVRERAFSRNLSRFEEVLLALNSELHLPHGVSSMVDEGEYASIRKLGTMKIGGRRATYSPLATTGSGQKKAAEVLVNKSLLLGWFCLTQLGVN